MGVCAHELADPQLALFLARLLEPTPGPLLAHVLAEELLPRERYLLCVTSTGHVLFRILYVGCGAHAGRSTAAE